MVVQEAFRYNETLRQRFWERDLDSYLRYKKLIKLSVKLNRQKHVEKYQEYMIGIRNNWPSYQKIFDNIDNEV